MNKKTNSLSALLFSLAIIVLLAACSGSGSPAERQSQYSPEHWFTFDGEGDLVASDAFPDGPMSIVIPSRLGGIPVTSIGDFAFADAMTDRFKLTSVTIPNSVMTIGEGAFAWNNLTGVIIPDSVTFIGSGAFFYNNLTSITLGNGITGFGDHLFGANSDLITVTVRLQQGETEAQARERLDSNWFDAILDWAEVVSFVQ